MKNKRARKEYLKSILVGLSATLIDFFITALIIYIEGHEDFKLSLIGSFFNITKTGKPHSTPVSVYLTANMISFILSYIYNYFMCVFFVYEYGNVGKNKKGFMKFMLFGLIGLTVSLTVGLIGFAGLGGSVWLVKIVTALVVFVFNFFTRKYFVFNIALIRDDDNTIEL